jgi:hypothetical protein
MTASAATRVQIGPSVYARAFDEGLVVLDLKRGEYFGLDGVGRRMWELLVDAKAVGQVADLLVEEYEVERDALLADVIALTEELLDRGLLVLWTQTQ